MARTNGRRNGALEHRRPEVNQAVDNACEQMRSEGIPPRIYVEQLAWLFFLKAFDETETRHEQEASFEDAPFARRLDGEYRWSAWSARKDSDDMLNFVKGPLWTKLENLGDDALAERFLRIFSTVRNHFRRGVSFAKVVQQVNRLHFSDETDVIVLSELYENLLKQVAADSVGWAGEFYTQRHIIRAMVDAVRPRIGDRIYDPCFGSAGFLCEAVEYIRGHTPTMNAGALTRLQHQTFFGNEIQPLTYLLGTMNMLLHRVEGANLELGNTLERHTASVPEKDRYQVILANPPYGGRMDSTLQTNFTIRSGSTEVLFLQHIMANLAKGGRAGVILPEGVLFRGGPDAKVRKRLLEEFKLHTILSLPAGCFLPYTRALTAPQVLVANAATVQALGQLGRRLAYLPTSGPNPADPALIRLGRHLRFLWDHAGTPGQQLVVSMTDLRQSHWTTAQSEMERQSLPALDGWIEPLAGMHGFAAAACAEEQAAGPVPPAEADEDLDPLVQRFNEQRNRSADPAVIGPLLGPIEAHYRPLVEGTWRLLWRCRDREAGFPEARSVSRRWDEDREAYTRHMDWLAQGGLRRTRQTPRQAVLTKRRLEEADRLVEAEEACDDPLRMLPYVLVNRAVSGRVVAVQRDHWEGTGRSRVRRPLVTLHAPDECLMPLGKKLYWSEQPGGREFVVEALDPAPAGGSLVRLKRMTGSDTTGMPTVGEQACFSILNTIPAPFTLLPDDEPWTHQPAAMPAVVGSIED
jgi:type I restriction enzyme M protein